MDYACGMLLALRHGALGDGSCEAIPSYPVLRCDDWNGKTRSDRLRRQPTLALARDGTARLKPSKVKPTENASLKEGGFCIASMES